MIAGWPVPNYVNPVTRGPTMVVVHLTLYFLVLPVVALRIFTRLYISRSFGLDDAFIVFAMIPTTAFVAVTLVAEFNYGWDRHAWDVPLDMVTVGLQLSLVSQIFFALAGSCTRLSMLFLSRRILSSINPILHKFIIFAIIIISAACIVFITVVIFQCNPISDVWTVSFTPQHCVDNKTHLLVQGILNIIADFLVVLIPIPIVLKLNLPMRQRIIVALLFGAGFIVCFAGIARTVYMYRLLTEIYYDVTWDAFPLWLATAVELYLGIVCTSTPPTKPFFARYLPKLISATTHYTHSNSQRGSMPTFASSKNTALVNNVSSRNASETSIGLRPVSCGAGSGRERDFIHKKIEISQTRTVIEELTSLSRNTSIEGLVGR